MTMTNPDTIAARQEKTVRIVRRANGGARVMLLRTTAMPIHLCDAVHTERDGNYMKIYSDDSAMATFYIRTDIIEWADYDPLGAME
jgi:hypothetical protein